MDDGGQSLSKGEKMQSCQWQVAPAITRDLNSNAESRSTPTWKSAIRG